MGSRHFNKVAVIGGGGYVGSELVPQLAQAGYQVTVLDLFLYGDHYFDLLPQVTSVKVDVRNEAAIHEALRGADAIIHLACVSNDPSFELDPRLGKSINFDAFPGVLRAAKANGVQRFIYASSSSVYGVKEQPDVTEETSCDPLTDYSKFKLECERLMKAHDWGSYEHVIIRPATVCGYAPRMRLDLSVNILTIHALVKKKITVFGGSQLRPNLNIQDMVGAYKLLLEAPGEKLNGQTFNIGYSNLSLMAIADLVRTQLNDPEITIATEPTNDLRSYHVNSDKVGRVLGFQPHYKVEQAVQSIADAYRAGKIPDPLTNQAYYNVKVMQKQALHTPLAGASPRG